MSIRGLKEKSRRRLHNRLGFRANYIAHPSLVETVCVIRAHDYQGALGDLAGYDYDPTERLLANPQIVVLADEIVPTRSGVFVVSDTEAYRVLEVPPAHGLTITVQASRLTAAEIAAGGYQAPAET